MSTKALRKELLAAIAMVIVAAIALSGSTYAWFATNNTVTATGMIVTTQVSDNLFIAAAAHADATIKPEANFRTTEVFNETGLLEPVSTNNGQSFWYSSTKNVNGDGQVKNLVWANYGTTGLQDAPNPYHHNNFSVNYIPEDNADAVGFVDYVYDLKAVVESDTTLDLTKLDLTYADQQANIVNSAFRVAVFVEEASGSGENTGSNYTVTAAKDNAAKESSATVANGKADWIFAPTDKATNNFTTNGTTNAVVTGEDSVATMTYKTTAASFEVAAGVHYYKVVVRLWLEGQDKNCNNTTFAKLESGKWGLNTEWKLGGSANAVTAINVVESLKSAVDLSAAIKTGTTQVINGVTYAQLSTAGYWVNNAENFTSTSRVFTISEDGMITEVTHIVTLPNPAP